MMSFLCFSCFLLLPELNGSKLKKTSYFADNPFISEEFERDFDTLENWEIEVVSEPYNNELQYYTDR